MPIDDQGEITVVEVDDERKLADLYALYLEEVYETCTAYDGDEALEAVDEDVDVVLLDRRIPTMPGSQVLAEFRDLGYEQLVVMLTAVDPGDEILELGIDEYFGKPVSEEHRWNAVEALLARTRYDDESRNYASRCIRVEPVSIQEIHLTHQAVT